MEEIKLLLLICKNIFFYIISKKVIMDNPDYHFLANLVEDIPDEGINNKKRKKKNNSEGNNNKK